MADKRYNIVYEDEWLIVVDKPSGMLVIPTPKKETNTLTDLLNCDLDKKKVSANAYPCHRLDRETSGLVVYSKGPAVQKLMMEKFRLREVKKSYIAIVQGKVAHPSGTIDKNIYNRNKKRSDNAITKYKVSERKDNLSVLEVEPVTGRTNQIRIHLQSIGHPIVGESVYAFRKDFKLRFKRVCLHAARLEFKHPVTGAVEKFESPLPCDMKELIKRKG